MLDPQQRLLLETVWEAASVAGAGGGASLIARTRPSMVAGGKKAKPAETGVYVGASCAEWAQLQQQLGMPPSAFSASGSGLSVLAGAPGRLLEDA